MIDILSMIDDTPPESQAKPCVLYGPGGFLIKDPSRFNRNEKLAYVESKYKRFGTEADGDKFIMEIRCSRGLSSESFRKAREYGLYIHNRTN